MSSTIYQTDKACGSWSMGRGFETHQGHWSCQEGHQTTISPVFQTQISPKTDSEKSQPQGISQDMET